MRLQVERFMGLFGNQLTTYAFARTMAAKLGASLEVPLWVGRRIFPKAWLQLMQEPKLPGLEAEQIPEFANVAIHGYYQNARAFAMMSRKQIREWLAINPDLLSRCPKPRRHYIACHIRRGDNLRPASLERYAVVEPECYEEAVRRLGLSTRDIIWISQEEPQPGTNEMPIGLEFLYDFMVMMQADVLLRANSTYSQWAAILGDEGQRVYSPRVGNRVGFLTSGVEFEEGNHCALTSPEIHHTGHEDMILGA